MAAGVADQVAEKFLDAVDELDDSVDEVDSGVDEWPAERVRSRLKQLRHEILRVRRQLGQTREALHKVVDRRVDVEGGEPSRTRSRSPSPTCTTSSSAHSTVSTSSRDLLAGVRDYHQAKVANDQNEVTKRLTALASMLLVPTFIVGLYGQNFRHHFPELAWQYGYAWSWGLIIATTLAQLCSSRRVGWI